MAIIDDYEFIKSAALLIAYDNGAIHRECSEEDWLDDLDPLLASLDKEDLVTLNTWLGSLSDIDLDILCTGEDTVRKEIEERSPVGGQDGAPLVGLLNDIFEN